MRLTKVLGYYGVILLLAVVLLVSEDAVLMQNAYQKASLAGEKA